MFRKRVACPAEPPYWLCITGHFSPVHGIYAFYAHLKWAWTLRQFWLCISLILSTWSQMRDGDAFQPLIPNVMPPPVTALQGLRWSMSFQPFAGTMLLVKNDIRHWFAYFLQWKRAVSPKVPQGHEKFDLYHDRLNEGETKHLWAQKTPPTPSLAGNRTYLETQETSASVLKIIWSVLLLWTDCPFTRQRRARLWGSAGEMIPVTVYLSVAPGPPPPSWSLIRIHLDPIQRLKGTTAHPTRGAD